MKSGIRERLPEYVMDLLPPAEMAALTEIIEADPALRGEADQLRMALTTVVDELPPMEPSPQVRRRVMDAAGSVERFGPFVAQLSQIVQLSREKMREVLALIDQASFWVQGLPGVELAHFDAAPALAGADAGFIRMEAGASFPRHRHLVGREITFVLQGSLLDGDRAYGPGEIVEHASDTVHAIAAGHDQPLLIMVVHHGIQPVFGE
jgi:hypothetical protein